MPKEGVKSCNKAHTLAKEYPNEFCVNASGEVYYRGVQTMPLYREL